MEIPSLSPIKFWPHFTFDCEKKAFEEISDLLKSHWKSKGKLFKN